MSHVIISAAQICGGDRGMFLDAFQNGYVLMLLMLTAAIGYVFAARGEEPPYT